MSDVYDEVNEANYKLSLHMEAIEKIRDQPVDYVEINKKYWALPEEKN